MSSAPRRTRSAIKQSSSQMNIEGQEVLEQDNSNEENEDREQGQRERDQEEFEGVQATPAPSKSNRGSGGSANSNLQDTPNRAARLDEKKELQDLNKRLEFYILRQRERDASNDGMQREVDAIKAQAHKDLSHATSLYESQLNDIRKAKDEQAQLIASHEAQIVRLSELNRQLEDRLNVESGQRNDFSNRLDNALSELSKLKNLLSEANAKNKTLQGDLQTEEGLRKRLEKELNQARKQIETLAANATSAENENRDLKADLENLTESHKDEITRFQREVTSLAANNNRSESQIRSALAKEFEQQVREIQKKNSENCEEIVRALKLSHDVKLEGYKNSLEASGHELELARQENIRAKADAYDFQLKIQALEKQVNELKERLVFADKAARSLSQSSVIAKKNETIRMLKKNFIRKDNLCTELQEDLLLLEMEIKAYRELLEAEENRLGMESSESPRKRKVKTNNYNDAQNIDQHESAISNNNNNNQDEMEEERSAPVLISNLELESRTITFRSNTNREISLNGWSVRSQKSGLSYVFNDISLQPGESICIQVIDPSNPAHADLLAQDPSNLMDAQGNRLLLWRSHSSWDENGDQAQLVESSGRVIAVVDISPNETSQLIGGEEEPLNNPAAAGSHSNANGNSNGSIDGDVNQEGEEGEKKNTCQIM